MVTIKVFDTVGVKEVKCFETLDQVDYLDSDPEEFDDTVEDKNPFE